jgi:hypothetical protein
LDWQAIAGKRYQPQYSTSIVGTNWIAVGSEITASTNSAFAIDTAIGGLPIKFYRLELKP